MPKCFDLVHYFNKRQLTNPRVTPMRPASQNPYPICDQNQRFSPPYLWSETEAYLSDKAVSSRKHTQLKTRVQTTYPMYDQNRWKPYPLGLHMPI